MKHCSKCKEQKPLHEFHRNKTNSDGLQTYCKPCMIAARKATPSYNTDESKIKTRLYKRGVTPIELARMVERADGRCEICDRELELVDGLQGLVIDHVEDRPLGERGRGLLCDPCNRGLGCFRDDPKRLEAAISYLEADVK